MITRKTFFILSIILPSAFLFPQKKDEVLATAGGDKITVKEFKTRYELMPHISRFTEPDSIKREFLYSLISEKLWAAEAESEGLDTAESIKGMMKPLEKMYVRDALFEKEIGSKIHISKKEIKEGVFKSGIDLAVKVISSKDSADIFEVYNYLKEGAPFDSLLQTRPGYAGQHSTLKITFGQMKDKFVEDTLYSLKLGQFSSPVKTADGWFIFKLKNKISKAFKNDEEERTAWKVENKLKERESKIIGEKYLDSLLAGKKVETNTKLFLKLAGQFAALLKDKKDKGEINRGDFILLDNYDVIKMIGEMGNAEAESNLILFKKDPMTVKSFLHELSLYGFKEKNIDPANVRDHLERAMKKIIQQELIAREGYKQGLDKLPEVKKQLGWWKENWSAKMLRDRFADSAEVSDKDAYNYYLEINNNSKLAEQVNILEILNSSLDTMQVILDKLKNGADFKKLAKQYTQRSWTKDKGGEFGYFPVTMYGEIGRAASNMKIGETYGPLKVPEGYSLFKLIGKKEAQKVPIKSFDQNKDKIKSALFAKRLEYYFNKYTTKFANKFGFTADLNLLKSVKVTNINMFTHRYMGFGGVIAAVPYTDPEYNWIDYWKKNGHKVVP